MAIVIAYDLALIPGSHHVDLDMTIRNLTDELWTDVFASNCISPARADAFRDSTLERTDISVDGRPRAVGGIVWRHRAGTRGNDAFTGVLVAGQVG